MALEIDLTGKAVLVTGGTKGVGRGIAQRFADAGASVVVCARREPENPLPDGWTFVPADLRDGEAAWAAVDAAHAVHGRLDCVVNNAGGSPPADSAEASPRFSERIVALNLLAPMFVAQRAYHHMKDQPEGGSIVNVGSIVAQRPSPTTAAYGAAKAGLKQLTQTLAMEWAPRVRVELDHLRLHPHRAGRAVLRRRRHPCPGRGPHPPRPLGDAHRHRRRRRVAGVRPGLLRHRSRRGRPRRRRPTPGRRRGRQLSASDSVSRRRTGRTD